MIGLYFKYFRDDVDICLINSNYIKPKFKSLVILVVFCIEVVEAENSEGLQESSQE